MASPVGNPIVFPSGDLHVYWVPAAASPVMSGGEVVAGYTDYGGTSYHYRAAIQFAGSEPSWHDTVVSDGGILLYVSKVCAQPLLTGSKVELQAGRLNGAFTEASTVAELDILWAAATWSSLKVQVNAPGWYLVPFSPTWMDYALDYGIVFRLTSSYVGTAVIAVADPLLPEVRTYYGLDYPSSSYASNDQRGALSARALAQLEKAKPQWAGNLVLTALRSKARADLSDIELSDHLSVAKLGDWNSRAIELPDTWALAQSKPGGLTVQSPALRSEFTPGDLTGAELTLDFRLSDGAGTFETIHGGKSRVVRAGRRADDTIDMKLDDPYSSLRHAGLFETSALQGDYISYTSAQVLDVLWDMLINSPRRLRTGYWTATTEEEPGVYGEDWWWLRQRFLATWPLVDISTGEAEEMTVRELAEAMARLLGLFVGTGHDGRILVFHPSVYRPSRRIWSLNLSDAAQGKAVVKDITPRATGLTIPDDDQTILVRGRAPLSSVEMGEQIETIPMDEDLFGGTVYKLMKYGHLQHLTYRYTNEYNEITVVTNHRGLPWSHGDLLLVTSVADGLDETPFLILAREGADTDAEVLVRAYSWPEWSAPLSLFEKDTIRGVWRWADEDHAFDGTCRAWGANASTDTFSDIGSTIFLFFAEWGGALLQHTSTGRAEVQVTSFETAGAKYTDVFEVPYAVKGMPIGFTVDETLQDWWLWKWQQAGTDKALCAFIHRAPFASHPKDGSSEHSQYALGYTRDITATPISWDWVIYAPAGVGYDSGTGSELAVDYLAAAMSPTEVRFYINGREVGTESWTRNVRLDTFHVRASGSYKTAFGRLRVLQLGGRFPETAELVGANGDDPYYP